jgi:hypothetical protein
VRAFKREARRHNQIATELKNKLEQMGWKISPRVLSFKVDLLVADRQKNHCLVEVKPTSEINHIIHAIGQILVYSSEIKDTMKLIVSAKDEKFKKSHEKIKHILKKYKIEWVTCSDDMENIEFHGLEDILKQKKR